MKPNAKVAIDLLGESGGGMTEAFLDNAGMGTGFNQADCMAVPQVVYTDTRIPSFPGQLLDVAGQL